MRMTRREVGARGEQLAADFLVGQGYVILQRNFRCREGEIDIVAQLGESLVFVEVRTRRGSDFGAPEESISRDKREKLVALAEAFVQTCDIPPASWRIDVVAVELAFDNEVARLEHIESAVD
jgi:putative endonuclease